jgi:hypothetical protein
VNGPMQPQDCHRSPEEEPDREQGVILRFASSLRRSILRCSFLTNASMRPSCFPGISLAVGSSSFGIPAGSSSATGCLALYSESLYHRKAAVQCDCHAM